MEFEVCVQLKTHDTIWITEMCWVVFMTSVDLDLGKTNKKGNERKTRETVRPCLGGLCDLGTKDMKKAEILNTFFTSFFCW